MNNDGTPPIATAPAYLRLDGGVATIVLNRPEKYNVIDQDMAIKLKELGSAAAAATQVRILVIRGAGPAFCAGGDIRHFLTNLDDLGTCIRRLLTPYHEFLQQLREMPKLVVAAVHGSVAGAGLSLASMCDLCVAADDAVFTPAYAKIGVSPDAGGTYGLPRAVGWRRALQIYVAEESFSAQQGADWGLVSKVLPSGAFEAEVEAYVARLVRLSPDATANTKRLLRASVTTQLEGHLFDEMESLIRCMGTPTFGEAIQKFVSKGQ